MHDTSARVTEWIRLYTPRLLGVARAFAVREEEAEDLLQELWIVAFREAGHLSDATPVAAWLHAILLNIGRMSWRRRRRRERLTLLWHGQAREESTGDILHLNVALERAVLWRSIADLPQLQRRVLLARIVDDLSTRQTAEYLGVAEGTVKASLHRALSALRAAPSFELLSRYARLALPTPVQEDTPHG